MGAQEEEEGGGVGGGKSDLDELSRGQSGRPPGDKESKIDLWRNGSRVSRLEGQLNGGEKSEKNKA